MAEPHAIQIARLDERIKDLDNDVRAFAPMVRDVEKIRWKLELMQSNVGDLKNSFEVLTNEFQTLQKEKQRNRITLWVAGIGLVGTFLSSIALVLTTVLAN